MGQRLAGWRYWCWLWVACAAPMALAQVPVITSLNPNNVNAGGPGFTLTVNGNTFLANAVVRVNGAPRATVFNGPTQLTAAILPGDIAAPGAALITVFNTVIGAPGGGFTSGPAFLVINATGPPTLTSVTPSVASPGASQVRLTLLGTNFHPGATVVVSPPLTNVNSSTANQQAVDISVDNVTRVSDRMMYAQISISSVASTGLRAVDVVNTDATNTGNDPSGSSTSRPLRITPSTSLGAPLNVTTIAITNPRDGTVLSQGEEAIPQGALAGTGSGTVIGAWVWDGAIIEQFNAVFAGGQSVTISAQQPLPTTLVGPHTLELRILSPNALASRPIALVVNPSDFSLEYLLAPPPGATVTADEPPHLRWAPVPGADKYEVGLAGEPYFSSVPTWYVANTNEWTVPAEVWRQFSDGPIYWTVRTVEMTGQRRPPAPMRLMRRFPAGALGATAKQPRTTPRGDTLLEWTGISGRHFYRVTVSSDAEGKQIVRRYLTAKPEVDLRALRGQLEPGKTYYWSVEALDPGGAVVLVGPTQSFSAPSPSSRAWPESKGFAAHQDGGAAAPEVKTIKERSPAPDATVSAPKTPIVIDFTTAPNPFDLAVQVDGTDVTSLAEVADTKVAYTPATPLGLGPHVVAVTLGAESSSWKFSVAEAPKAAAQKNDAEKTPGAAKTPVNPKLQNQTQLGMNTQWVSGPAADTNVLSAGEQLSYRWGNWTAQINGSALLASVLGPEELQTSRGRASNYIFQTEYQKGRWDLKLRFGMVAPFLYQDSQFVTTAIARQGFEAGVKSPAGTVGFYVNTADAAQGGGLGFGFHQRIYGASWDLPLPARLLELRLMWLSAHDTTPALTLGTNLLGTPITTGPVSPAGGGDLYGALLKVHLAPKWLWSSEYAWGYNDFDLKGGSAHLFGRAWRSGVAGSSGPASLTFHYIETSPNFASPANPNLSPASTPDRRGPAAVVTLNTKAGMFTVSETYLQSNFDEPNSAQQNMNSLTESWSKRVHQFTTLSVAAHETRTTTGDVPPAIQSIPDDQRLAYLADQRDIGGTVGVTRQVGKAATVTISGSRDWFRNDLIPAGSSITSSINGTVVWLVRPFFQFHGNVGSNWVSGEDNTVGTTRSLSAYLQPTLIYKRIGVQVQPIIAVNQSRTALGSGALTSDLLSGQYGGRVSWTMPGELKFSTLTFEGDYGDVKNPVLFFHQKSATMFLMWTISWGYKHTS